VLQEYTAGWTAYRDHLQRARVLDEWLSIPGLDGGAAFYNVEGKLSYEPFNSAEFYRQRLLEALKTYFPQAGSVTEFGCGVGRNLLFLKREMPRAECQGYELCAPGVEVGRAAAEKFGLSVQYAQLDFLNDPPEKYVLPTTDVAFTMFALEQIPRGLSRALKNILDHAKMGAIHIEPVVENYPLTLRGILGRIDHWKVDYLREFDRSARALKNVSVVVEPIHSAHNPLMFPSLYVLRNV
jgi:SAM-dependent methyltransferase